MKHCVRTLSMVLVLALGVGLAHGAALPGEGKDKGKTVVYRDTWGIPHIYGDSVEAGMYALGYAQAEDRPTELLMNYKRALGESAEVEGPGGLMADVVVRMFDHYGVSKRGIEQVRPEVRSHVQAFLRGVNDFYAAHPEDVPEWWGDREIDEYMCMAFGRLFLYNWSIDDGFGDLMRIGIRPGAGVGEPYSNQWAVSKERSATGNPILYIDPHLSWFGPSRFFEFRIHAGELEGSGFTLAGQPYIGLGHNANLAWAMTTGGPDTADVYELTMNPDNPMQYKYDGEWRNLTGREETFKIKGGGEKTVTLFYSHHGPIVAQKDGKAYAHKTAYANVANGNEAWYHLNFAKSYHGAIDAMASLTVFPQNVMCADTSGNIYYQRTGRVPIRPEGYDWTKPLDGSTSKTEWQGFHSSSDHLQVLNPEHGYLQNCNIPPDAMMPGGPFPEGKYKDYLVADRSHGPRYGWLNHRGARAIDLLQQDDSVTVEEALDYALDIKPFGVDRWVQLLKEATTAHPVKHGDALKEVLAWNMELARDSAPALKYYAWRKTINDDLGDDKGRALIGQMEQFYAELIEGKDVTPQVDDATREAVAQAFDNAMEAIIEKGGSLDVVYGDYFRVGRDDQSWPLGGGGDRQNTGRTLRSIGYTQEREDGTRWGRNGQTSTQIVHMSKPIESWTQPPIGQSDRPESPHYTDQAEKLLSERQMKDTWWMPEELKDHIQSRTVLKNAG